MPPTPHDCRHDSHRVNYIYVGGGGWRQEVKVIVIVSLPFRLWPISIYVAEPSRVSGSLFRVSHFRQNSRGSRTNGLATDEHMVDH